LDLVLDFFDPNHSINSIDNTVNNRAMKVSEANKRIYIWLAKILGFGIPFVLIDTLIVERYFGVTITEAIIENLNYRFMAITIIVSYLSGQVEGRYMHYKYQVPTPDKHNPHFGFTVIRFVAALPMLSIINCKIFLCYMAVFPFIHDGALYAMRNKLNKNIYHKKWFAIPDKTEDMAWTDIVFRYPIVRVAFAVAGIVCLTLIQIYN